MATPQVPIADVLDGGTERVGELEEDEAGPLLSFPWVPQA